jgi:hypothetical protein
VEIISVQIIFDLAFYSDLTVVLTAFTVSVFLYYLWYKQDNRLLTDLPLMFSIVFMAHAVKQIIITLTTIGILESTLDVFRLRGLAVGGIALPMVGVLLHIWLPRIRKYHLRIMALVTIYWAVVALLGPSEHIIQLLHLPVIVIFMGGMVLTFTITWKTGRLKEVRSDLMVVSTLLSLIGQIAMIPLMDAGLSFVSGLIAVIATVTAAVALSNPWYRRSLIAAENQQYQENQDPTLLASAVYE